MDKDYLWEERIYRGGCKCHGQTFCPDLICIGYDDDVPVFVRRDSPEGRRQRELDILGKILR